MIFFIENITIISKNIVGYILVSLSGGQNVMARLRGKQTDNSLPILIISLLILGAIVVPLQYSNAINLVDGFGDNQEDSPPTNNVSPQPSVNQDTLDKVDKIDK
ncbi:MAG TPA: hypothetical protein V6D15_14465 [Oculatellaceae cyanobacterium]|jgi:hypothetical protein